MMEMEPDSEKVCKVGLQVKQTSDNGQCLLYYLYTDPKILSGFSSSIANIRCSHCLHVLRDSCPHG
jgi:hypothetical protein